ncbi:MAG: hypothetical protein WC474_05480 [Hydrogenophilaceae bacterium]
MNRKQNITLPLIAGFLAGLVVLPAAAADNPFAARASADGYRIAAAEAKCGEGKCGAAMGMGDSTKADPGKTTAEKAVTEKTKVKAKAKTKTKAKTTEATMKCGEGKCGAAMGMTEQDKAKMQKSEEGKCGGSKK